MPNKTQNTSSQKKNNTNKNTNKQHPKSKPKNPSISGPKTKTKPQNSSSPEKRNTKQNSKQNSEKQPLGSNQNNSKTSVKTSNKIQLIEGTKKINTCKTLSNLPPRFLAQKSLIIHENKSSITAVQNPSVLINVITEKSRVTPTTASTSLVAHEWLPLPTITTTKKCSKISYLHRRIRRAAAGPPRRPRFTTAYSADVLPLRGSFAALNMASNPQQGPPKAKRQDNRKPPNKNSAGKLPNNNANNFVKHPPRKNFAPRTYHGKPTDTYVDGFVSVPSMSSMPLRPSMPVPLMSLNAQSVAAPNKPGTSGTSKTDKVLKDVMDALDCPICLEFLKPPIFLCESGHDICGKCRAKLCLPICPMCKTTITNQRNFRLEEIVGKMVTSCTNSSFGCDFAGSGDEVKSHFEECEFRQLFCPLGKEFNQCLWNGSLSQLKKHFSESHPRNTVLKPAHQVLFDNFDLNKPDQDMQLVCENNTLYLYHVKIDPVKQLAFWGVQQIGIQNDSDKSVYEFCFYNSKKPKKVINFSEFCQPDNKSFQDIYESGNCVSIPMNVLKNFLHENKKFTFKFFIKKMAGNIPKHVRNTINAETPRARNNEIDALSQKLDLLM